MKSIKQIPVFLLIISFNLFSQVGINTTSPDASSTLDIVSTTQGFLAPRMTEAQRDAIASPAEGLVIYVTDLDGFYFYESTSTEWKEIVNGDNKRDNFVLVKSEADFPTPSGGVITLDTDTYYDINGTVVLTNSIELNNAYIAGADAFEDVLYKASGNLFTGTTGGTVNWVTISVPGGNVFNLSAAVTENFVMQNCVVANCSSVGSITGFGLLFMNIVQFTGNSGGITFTGNGGDLLLSNLAWLSDNTGTFETYSGTFNIIEKISGFSDIPSGSTAVDVSSNPTVASGVIRATNFKGLGTSVTGYSPAPYAGYRFSNE